MSRKLTESELEYIVERVLENARDAFEESNITGNEFINGRKLAYYEVLDTIKNELIARDVDLSRFGLDINLEELL